MIKSNKYIWLIVTAILFHAYGCTQETHIVIESDAKFNEAPEKFPELTFVTVDEFAGILSNDSADYKILVFNPAYTFEDNWSQIIADEVIPKWRKCDTTSTSIYLITCDCASLGETDSFFKAKGLDFPRYVIRDSAEHLQNATTGNKFNRINAWLSRWTSNADMLTEYVSFRNTVVIDKRGYIKLGLFNCPDAEEKKAAILPVPFEFVTFPVADFKKIERITVEKDNYMYYWYFGL